jgi:iron complex outermembrane receptor protein
VRHDSSSRASGAYTPRYGLAWRPVSPVLFRASMGKGFLLPTLFFSDRSTISFASVMTAVRIPIDPLRGNENMLGRPITLTSGGNPKLRPQRSENWTYGVVFDVPRVKRLSLSFDYFNYKYRDQIAAALVTIPDLLAYAPELITRGPNLPGDQPGWPGPITGLRALPVNVSVARTAGYNFGATWTTSTPFGDLSLKSSGERILVSEQRLTPTSAPLASANKKFNPLRVVSNVFWSRGAWEAGVTNIHSTGTWADSQNTALVPSGYSPDSNRWDVNASYDFAKGGAFREGQSWWRRLMDKSKVNITIINALNTEPPLDVNGFLVTNTIDPRLRRYVIDFSTRF